jgi:hypothetical protein
LEACTELGSFCARVSRQSTKRPTNVSSALVNAFGKRSDRSIRMRAVASRCSPALFATSSRKNLKFEK